MDSEYEYLKDLIKRGIEANMPRDASLILLGRIINTLERHEISLGEAYELEDMLDLGSREEYQNILSFATTGMPDLEE
ncbi:hypothetical protein GlitD10_0530 [Gloeomargarita lithophora Alchichica-D10]|uniref:Uncharacterized protein n=1 Tax=Gloeomargarita lithophora Alchichica-D10 TaxID=1188229 RepID=A0A1J0AA74_9CYAN|nr:hypothetical protein [Gloeomargarita lithophora]APB32844.1 hypothetical protein GlitD10_0530 [Gloeomargarita lithophora Alchichica-D10]